ncbi:hypothetical protein BDK51DRAFT_25626 [Blyttiomyces helicus]|uniref:Uncharacterized protein n=1 Tax=Blyttiomyces helicus TaxID=388810 RepID=A0A4P9WT21_9FUNG|nr:hypothetical protein BDK51DRAFT_25626 [Blyttiomyces helicus]|eukprot:RKO94196.1 hypothetical protein BDK51DRAFT_25626 [Blyttiomyces helicus]
MSMCLSLLQKTLCPTAYSESASLEENRRQWIDKFAPQEGLSADAAPESLSKTAGLLLDAVQSSSNPKFKSSKFMEFTQKLRDQEVAIEGNKVVTQISAAGEASKWAKEFGGSADTREWEEEFSMDVEEPGGSGSFLLFHHDLTETILALEAAVQNDPTSGKAWLALGLRQQENEDDSAAIAAFRVALDADPEGAAVAISVSYTNETRAADAYDALESWLWSSPAHRDSVERVEARTRGPSRHDAVTAMFMDGVRSAPGMEMNADIQVGLGVVCNVSEEYGKAVDCSEALRPVETTAARATPRGRQEPPLAGQAGSIDHVASEDKGKGRATDTNEYAAMQSVRSESVWSMLKIIADGHLGRHALSLAC